MASQPDAGAEGQPGDRLAAPAAPVDEGPTRSDCERAIGDVIEHAEGWAEQGGQLDAAEVARVLLLVLRQWTGGLRVDDLAPGRAPAETFERLMAIVREVDAHLDANTAEAYREQPLAGHWARITKVCEEAGEVWKALSKWTGENPRKGVCGTEDELLGELGDTASAAWCAIQHITKDETRTAAVIVTALEKAHRRVAEHAEARQ